MKIDLGDPSLFGNDAGEDEEESVLLSYFVEQPGFGPFLSERDLSIVNGRKGTGKSALLLRLAHDLRSKRGPERPVVLHLVPSELVALKEPPASDDHNILVNYWKQVMCGAINMELAKDIGFAWSDNEMALVESAEIAGFKGRDLLSSLMSRLVGKVNVGGVELTNTPRPSPDQQQLLRRLDREKGLRRPVWLLLDDLDARYTNSPAQRAFISAFFSAARYLANETQGVRVRATVRSDVWTSLADCEEMDKAEQYRIEIVWSGSQQKILLAQRVLAYVRRKYPEDPIAHELTARNHADELIGFAFTDKMKWGRSMVPPDHVVRILGGSRPRWIAQLCRMAGLNAVREGKDRIAVQHITQAMGEFGRRRLSDLYKEHHFQFGSAHELQALIESFAGGSRRYSTDELLKQIESNYVARHGADKVPAVDGNPYVRPLQIAKFLYRCGFINGNNASKARLEAPEFITYDLRRDLLEVATNLDDGMSWEVHPAYRNVLQIN